MQAADRRKGFHGIPQNFDDTIRIAGYKIDNEASHFLPDQAGLIFIPVHTLHFWHQHSDDATQFLQRRLKKHPNIIGVYLYSEFLHPGGALFRFPGTDDHFTRQQLNKTLIRYSLLVLSRKEHPAIQIGATSSATSALDG